MEKGISKSMKFLSVVLGALMGGFMWRCRGDGGWGSSWGLYAVGLVIMLLIYHFYSDRTGLKFEMIPIGSFLLGLGVTGYGTVIEQMAGVLWSDLPYSGELLNGQSPVITGEYGDVYVPVSPLSGTIIIFFMAFTLAPLFTVFVSSLFSKKEYGLKDYAIISVLFFVASLVFKATIAHPILKAVNPEQVQYAALGLKAYGYDYSSPFAAYMSHFQMRRWTQDIPFFENYYMSIEHISDALAILTVSAYLLFARKDKYTAFGSLVMDFFTGVASTALSPLISVNFHSGPFAGVEFPKWFMRIADWGVWEYATGFFFGLFVMLFLALTADRQAPRTGYDDTLICNDKTVSFVINFICVIFVFCVAPARFLGMRLAGLFKNLGVFPDDEPFGTIILVVIAIVFGLFAIKIMNKNILKKGANAPDMLPVDFARLALPIYLAACFVAYFFLDDVHIRAIKFDITAPIMLATFALIAVIYLPVRKKLAKK